MTTSQQISANEVSHWDSLVIDGVDAPVRRIDWNGKTLTFTTDIGAYSFGEYDLVPCVPRIPADPSHDYEDYDYVAGWENQTHAWR